MKRQRPLSIHVFALLMIAGGLADLIERLLFVDMASFEYLFPVIEWSRDTVIVFSSAMFSIVLIPVVAVWLFASRIARTIVTVMFAIALPWHLLLVWSAIEGAILSPMDLVSAFAQAFAVGLLYTKASSRWFAVPRRPVRATLA